jgi:hypothetical protein
MWTCIPAPPVGSEQVQGRAPLFEDQDGLVAVSVASMTLSSGSSVPLVVTSGRGGGFRPPVPAGQLPSSERTTMVT